MREEIGEPSSSLISQTSGRSHAKEINKAKQTFYRNGSGNCTCAWGLFPAGLIKDHKEYLLGRPWDASVQIASFNTIQSYISSFIFPKKLSPTQAELHQSFHLRKEDYDKSTLRCNISIIFPIRRQVSSTVNFTVVMDQNQINFGMDVGWTNEQKYWK